MKRDRRASTSSELSPSEPAAPSGALSATGGWGQLSERARKRLEEMIACGVPRDTADLTVEVFLGLKDDTMDWSIFADLEADPPTLQLSNKKTGAHIECSILGGPKEKAQPRAGE